jgi:hypothetical protein
MKKAAIVVGDVFFENNRLFDLSDPIANRDNCIYPFYLLRKTFREKGYDLATSDINFQSDSDIVLYNEMPKKMPSESEYAKSFLLLFESELIRPDNWNIKNHLAFKKIFTWDDKFIDNEKYFKINFSFEFPASICKTLARKSKLCTLISGNKSVKHPMELYSKRLEAIKWFERYHPEDFEFYGAGWGNYHFTGSRFVRSFNRIKPLTRVLATKYLSYKGRVEKKREVLESYKFSICYENARDISGYITEKIFDCFFAGCIPIYWGADNISKHIPDSCYIDMRKFSSYEEMYTSLTSMTNEEHLSYLEHIEQFLKSDKSFQFSADFFVETIVNQIE